MKEKYNMHRTQTYPCVDPEGGEGRGSGPPEHSPKNKGFLKNTGPDIPCKSTKLPRQRSVYKSKKIVGSNNCSVQFIKIISHYKKICYNINVLQHTACLVVNPITVGNFAFLFNCTPVGRTSDTMTFPT